MQSLVEGRVVRQFSLSLAGISYKLKSLFTEKKKNKNETILLQVSWVTRGCTGDGERGIMTGLWSVQAFPLFFFFFFRNLSWGLNGQSLGPYLHLRHIWLSWTSRYNCYINVNCTNQQKNVTTSETGQENMRTATGGIPYAILSLLQSNSFLTSSACWVWLQFQHWNKFKVISIKKIMQTEENEDTISVCSALFHERLYHNNNIERAECVQL